MFQEDVFANPAELARDVTVLETYRWYRKIFAERILEASASQDEEVALTLRLDATHQMAEFYYLLAAQGLRTEAQIEALANLHNTYIVELTKDATKMNRLGLKEDRLLAAMFTADTLPRLLQNWREKPGAIDQSNIARLLATVMSAETCRKVVLACVEAGFFVREKTSYGTMLISSTGVLERVFGQCLRDARHRLEGAKPAVPITETSS